MEGCAARDGNATDGNGAGPISVYGLWSMVYCLWSMVYSLRSVVYGLWSMVYQVRYTMGTGTERVGAFPVKPTGMHRPVR